MPGLLFRSIGAFVHGPVRAAAVAVVIALVAVTAVVPATSGQAVRAAERAVPPTGLCAIPGADREAHPAADLRATLARLLGEHAYLLMESMRATADGLVEAGPARDFLDRNSAALAAAIASVYGDDAGTAFRSLWDTHVEAAEAFATATRTGDTAAADEARGRLDQFRVALGGFLSKANPEVDADAEAEAVRLHLQHVTQFVAGDFAAAYASAREAYHHMFALGDLIARAIARQFPDRFPDAKVAFSPAAELRITLDRLLGEHLVLAAEAMRAGIAGAPDFAAARQALDANGADLGAAIRGIYGDDAGTAFGEVWGAHLVAYLDYVDAVRAGDAARTAAARKTLEAYGPVFGRFMAAANPNLTVEAVSGLISAHTASLIRMVDQYQGGDPEGAYGTAGEAYAHMFEVGDALAAAIAAQFPTRFEDFAEVPHTDAASGVLVAGTVAGHAGSTAGLVAGAALVTGIGLGLGLGLAGLAGARRASVRRGSR